MRALETRRSLAYSAGETPDRCHGFLVCEPVPEWPKRPRLLDQVRHAIRTRHYSPSTEKAYVRWIRRFILFHGT